MFRGPKVEVVRVELMSTHAAISDEDKEQVYGVDGTWRPTATGVPWFSQRRGLDGLREARVVDVNQMQERGSARFP